MAQIHMRKLYLIAMLLMVTILQSCTTELFQNDIVEMKGDVNIKLSTKALELGGANINKVRIIVCYKNDDRIRLNETNFIGSGSFVVRVPSGDYTFYAIVNEPENLTATLDGLTAKSDLNSIKIQPSTPFNETTVMLFKEVDASVAMDGDATIGGNSTPLTMELERVYTKVSLKINKETANPDDKFTVTKVDFVQSPACSYLNEKIYDGTDFVSRELFNGAIEFSNNGEEEGKEIIKEIPTGAEPSNIFAEYLLADADKSIHAKAAYLGITATYTPKGESPRDLYYKIPVGDYKGTNAVDGNGHDYNLIRNTHYKLDVKITKQGESNAVQIAYTVEPWKSQWIDVKIDGDPFLDVSNVEVDVYDAAATRVYFYSNMPGVELDPNLLNGTQSVPVNDNFEGLIGENAKNFTYNYNEGTQRGEGYFDLINIHTDNVVNVKRLLHLKSGKLVREIAATTRISPEAAKKNSQRYIGTFHRANERGERIVSWHLPTTTQWRVEIDNGTVDAACLRIDHLASPNHSKLYTLDPPNPEGAFVTENSTVKTLEGSGRIYFRVGWDSNIGTAKHRFAKIKVTTSGDNFATSDIQYLYCRQGEEPIAIISKTTLFSCYNISTPEHFVDYPTKTGFLYQWNRTQPWAVTGTVNNYPTGHESSPETGSAYVYKDYDPQTYICPSKYSYPDDKALTVMNNALNPTNVMYQWGYYADGFFDRRAVSEHIVRNASGDVASAGGLFFSQNTGVAIFLPTASWRDYQGVINSLTEHHQIGVIGHYWSKPQESEWNKPTTRSGTPELNAWSLHLTTEASPKSYLEALNKASAVNVRCMRLEGKTVYFDANGGLSTPRSITQESGNITFPAGPVNKNNSLTFTNWASTRSGSVPTYAAGATADINVVGEKTFYAQYQQVYPIGDKIYLVSSEVNPSQWAKVNEQCAKLLPANSWRLPTQSELEVIWEKNSALFYGQYWTSTTGEGHMYLSCGTPPEGFYDSYDDTLLFKARCIREFIK